MPTEPGVLTQSGGTMTFTDCTSRLVPKTCTGVQGLHLVLLALFGFSWLYLDLCIFL